MTSIGIDNADVLDPGFYCPHFLVALERPLPDGPLALCPAGAFLNPDFLPNDFTSFALLHDFNVKLATHRAYMN